jgi:DnaK suppressor protein
MDDKDYMNPTDGLLQGQAASLEKELLKNAGETTEHLRETVLVPDPADRATIEEEHALELRTRDRERKLLKKVQQSIVAIDNNDYGWCEETGEPIGIPRLIARPTATLSLEAQQRRELKQKLYGDRPSSQKHAPDPACFFYCTSYRSWALRTLQRRHGIEASCRRSPTMSGAAGCQQRSGTQARPRASARSPAPPP